jgi:hypothetical protein
VLLLESVDGAFEARTHYKSPGSERVMSDEHVFLALSQPLAFELRWMDRRAAITFGDGKVVHRRYLDFDPEALDMSCSTARVRFEGLWRDYFEEEQVSLVQLSLEALGVAKSGDHIWTGPRGPSRETVCATESAVLVRLRHLDRNHESPVNGAGIFNCAETPLRLVERGVRFVLEQRTDDGAWSQARDLTSHLCCDHRLGILDAKDDWGISGLARNLDAERRFRFTLQLRDESIHSEEFQTGR